MESRFNRHSDRLAERHGERVWRIGLDAGFSCPHREGGRGAGGCAFCAPDAGLAAYQHDGRRLVEDLDEQIARGLGFLRNRYGARLFFLYFQAYSCTNLPVAQLAQVYDNAVALFGARAPGALRGMVVSTRPDCLDRAKAELLSSYTARGMEVWLELGLQSSNDSSLARINRGHGAQAFVDAARVSRGLGLKRACHLILGLPGESKADMLRSAEFAAAQGMEGLKFHDLRLVKGSALARNLPAGEYAPLHPSRLPGLLAEILERLPWEVEILRLSADFPKGHCLDIFPPIEKNQLYTAVERMLAARNSRQGGRIAQRAAR
ncbi:MAG: TIGR01212 family radical SAM protein [Treponema sp.]|jgi:radical SAM protein (TIGR01212 family)|nr:TIGR01212 family radical SAM protein [Treponema sp.]